jgi:hypothetical protein
LQIFYTPLTFRNTAEFSTYQRGEWLSEIFGRWLRDARHDDYEPSDAIPQRDGIAGNTGKFCHGGLVLPSQYSEMPE